MAVSLDELQRRLPTSTAAECRRFHKAFGTESVERLAEYLEWRKEHQLADASWNDETPMAEAQAVGKNDRRNWEEAVLKAISHTRSKLKALASHQDGTASTKRGNRSRSRKIRNKKDRCSPGKASHAPFAKDTSLPRIVYCHSIDDGRILCDKEGHRLLHVLPAQIDVHAACADTYATAFALYLDRHLSRNDEKELTLAIDMRPGYGWPNPPAFQLISFIRHVAHALHHFYPHRLHRCILYPVPGAAIFLWQTIKSFLDPNLSSLMVLVAGSTGVESPLPKKKLQEYVDEIGLDRLEQTRLRAFRYEI